MNGNYVDSSGYPTSFFPFLPWELQYNQEHAGSGSSCQVKPCGAEFAIWPGPLVPDPARNRALILYGEIWRSPTYSGWVSIGEGIAIWQDGKITRPVIDPGTAYPTLMWQGSAVGFTSGWVVSGDTLYTYGNKGVFLAEDTQIAARTPGQCHHRQCVDLLRRKQCLEFKRGGCGDGVQWGGRGQFGFLR